MFGQINEWFYHDLAGIQCDPAGPGFRRIVLRPAMVGDVAWVYARYESVRGAIVCSWKRDGLRLTLDVTIPANTSATVCVPAVDSDQVMEGGRAARLAPGVRPVRLEPGRAVFEVGSGRYTFSSRMPGAPGS